MERIAIMSVIESQVGRLTEWSGLPDGVVWVMGTIAVALIIGTIARLSHLHRLPRHVGRSLVLRLRTWWIITAVLALVILAGRPAVVGLVCVVSILALREYFALTEERVRHRRITYWVYTAAALQYVWVYLGLFDLSMIFVPVVVTLVLTARVVLLRQPEGFMHTVGVVNWGMITLVFCISHVALLLALPEEGNRTGGGIGWFLYLVVLTEFNDIAQALFGRPLGRHKVIPEISPGKSWEGLIGAVACTSILALALAPLLTPLQSAPPRFASDGPASASFFSLWALLAGLLIGITGFFGDITMSAVKRDAHVKDSGTLLPGQGGILDRIDSLTFTAPLFFHYVHSLYYT